MGNFFSNTTKTEGKNEAQQQGTTSNQYGLTGTATDLGQQIASLFNSGSANAPVNQYQLGAGNNQFGVATNPAFGTGFNAATGLAQNGLGAANTAAQFNPFLNAVVNPTLDAQRIQNLQATSDIRGAMGKNNSLGNNVGNIAAYYAGVQPQQQAQISNLLNTGFNQAQNVALQSQGLGLQSIGNLSNANTTANAGLGQIGQDIWRSNYQNSLLPAQYAQMVTGAFAPLIQGSGSTQNTSGSSSGSYTGKQTSTPSPFSQAMSGLGIGSMGYDWYNSPSPKAMGGAVVGRASGGEVSGFGPPREEFHDKVERAFNTFNRMRASGGRVGFDAGGEIGPWSTTVNPVQQGMQPFSMTDRFNSLARQSGPQPNQNQNNQADPALAALRDSQASLRSMLGSMGAGRQGMADGGSPLADTIAEWGAWPAAMAANTYWNIFGRRNQTPASVAPQPAPAQQPAPDAPSAPPGHYLSNGFPAYNGPMPPTSGPDAFAAPGSLFAAGIAPRPTSNRGPFAQFDPYGSDPTNPFERPNGAMAATTEDAQRIGLNQGIVSTSLMQPQPNPNNLGGPPDANPAPNNNTTPPPSQYVRRELDKTTQAPPQSDPNPPPAQWSSLTGLLLSGGVPEARNMGAHIIAEQNARLAAARLAEEMRIHNRPTWGVIGHNIDNIPIYGWIDPQNQNATAQPGVGAPPANQPGQSMLTGQDYLATLDPARAAQLVAIDEGRAPMPPRTPRNQGLLAQLSQYNPALDATLWRARNTTHTGFASGPEARNTAAINMSIQHLLRLNQAINGLDNYSALPGIINPARNAVRDRTSAEYQAALDQFRAAAEASATELMRAFRGGSGTGSVSEIEAWGRLLDPNRSPEALRRTVQEGVHLLEGRITSLQNQYNNGMSTSNRPIPLLAPETLQGIEELTRQTTHPRRSATTTPANNTTGTQTPPPAAQTTTPPPNQAGPQPTPADLRQHFMSQPEGPVLLPNGQPAGYIRRGNQLIRAEGALGTAGNPFPSTADVQEAGQHAYHNGRLYRRTSNVISPLFQHRWEEVNQANGG